MTILLTPSCPSADGPLGCPAKPRATHPSASLRCSTGLTAFGRIFDGRIETGATAEKKNVAIVELLGRETGNALVVDVSPKLGMRHCCREQQ